VLVARDGNEVARLLDELEDGAGREIGTRALTRMLGSHTYAHRAAELDALLRSLAAKSVAGGSPVGIEPADRWIPAFAGNSA
jgi:spore maturation protein CgeB